MYRSVAIPAGRGLGRPDLPGTKRQAAISYVWGRRERAQPGLNAAAFPLKVSAPTSTQSTLLKSALPGIKKPRLVRTSRGFSLGASLEGSMFEPSRNYLRKAYVIGSPLFVASTSIRSNAIGAGIGHRRTAPSSLWLAYDCQRPRAAFVKPSCLLVVFIGCDFLAIE